MKNKIICAHNWLNNTELIIYAHQTLHVLIQQTQRYAVPTSSLQYICTEPINRFCNLSLETVISTLTVNYETNLNYDKNYFQCYSLGGGSCGAGFSSTLFCSGSFPSAHFPSYSFLSTYLSSSYSPSLRWLSLSE